jgi:hypothetical protein
VVKLIWDGLDTKVVEVGVDRGVLYSKDLPGVAWSGLLSVKEVPAGFNETVIYYDGQKVESQITLGEFSATIEAVTYPTEFEEFDGYSSLLSQQNRKTFNLCYRTMLSDDVVGLDKGYKLHLVYNALATPTEKTHTSLAAAANLSSFIWDISTLPNPIKGARPSAHLVIDSTVVWPGVMADLEAVLYGSASLSPNLPSIKELLAFFDTHALLKITDHGDGTFTAEGSDDIVRLIDATSFEISWPSAIYLDSITYQVSTF